MGVKNGEEIAGDMGQPKSHYAQYMCPKRKTKMLYGVSFLQI